jgi:hypothetical protein
MFKWLSRLINRRRDREILRRLQEPMGEMVYVPSLITKARVEAIRQRSEEIAKQSQEQHERLTAIFNDRPRPK